MASKAYHRKWYRENKETHLKKVRLYFKNNRTKIRASRHGMSLEEYENLLRMQKNRCAICRRIFRQTPHIDHCHATGGNRGLLCTGCNNGIARFEDNTSFLGRAIEYLQRTGR